MAQSLPPAWIEKSPRARRAVTQHGPLDAAHVSIKLILSRYFLGASTGVGTLSITEDEPPTLLI
jgi:hypothetical protein